jgi:hypothetical protein
MIKKVEIGGGHLICEPGKWALNFPYRNTIYTFGQ